MSVTEWLKTPFAKFVNERLTGEECWFKEDFKSHDKDKKDEPELNSIPSVEPNHKFESDKQYVVIHGNVKTIEYKDANGKVIGKIVL